jgi:hypothetical protein
MPGLNGRARALNPFGMTENLRFRLAMFRWPEYPEALRSADPCQILLDKSFGKVKYRFNGEALAVIWHVDA